MTLYRLKLFITLLLLNKKKKKWFFDFNVSSDLRKILQKAQEHHFILGYKMYYDKKITGIVLAYDQEGQSVLTNIKMVKYKGQQMVISFATAKVIFNNPYILCFVRTKIGILTIDECRTFGFGGEVLALFY
jgi:ribosomal protein S8